MITPALPAHVLALIREALREDVGDGDITARCFVAAERQAQAAILAKEPGIDRKSVV